MTPLREALVVSLLPLVVLPLIYAVVPVALIVSHLYVFGLVLEFFLVGFLGIVFALLDRDRFDTFGLGRQGRALSLAFGGLLVAVQAIVRSAAGAAPFGLTLLPLAQSVAQPFPYNIVFALLLGFAYGPLEVFFIVFLVVRMDRAIPEASSRLLSKGTIVGVVLWASIHITNAAFFGLFAAAIQVVEAVVVGLILMAIFRYTKCSIGPMMYWTVSNLFQWRGFMHETPTGFDGRDSVRDRECLHDRPTRLGRY